MVHGRRYAADGSQVFPESRGYRRWLCLPYSAWMRLHLVGDLLNGLFPGNALPLSRLPRFAYAAHGTLDAVGAVNVVDMPQAPQADAINATVEKKKKELKERFDVLTILLSRT